MQLLLLRSTIFGACLASQSAIAATYDCRTNYTVENRDIFRRQFVISSNATLSDATTGSKELEFKFNHKNKKIAIDCGVVDQPDKVQNLVCGLGVWNERAHGWDTVARAVTEIGAPMLAVLQSIDNLEFDINCQLRAPKL